MTKNFTDPVDCPVQCIVCNKKWFFRTERGSRRWLVYDMTAPLRSLDAPEKWWFCVKCKKEHCFDLADIWNARCQTDEFDYSIFVYA